MSFVQSIWFYHFAHVPRENFPDDSKRLSGTGFKAGIHSHFCLSPVKVFAWHKRRVVKPTEQDENLSFALFAFEVQIFRFQIISS